MDIGLTVPVGKKAVWLVSFVMSTEHHVRKIMSGENTLIMTAKFNSKDMGDIEKCEYEGTWEYTKGKFSIINDNRHYELIK